MHIGLIPDGNRRWAKLHGVPALEGHRRGAEAMHSLVEQLINRQIKYLTVWGFSMDNWKRSEQEIQDLLHLLAFWIHKDAPWLHSHGVRLRHIGRLNELPDFLQVAINEAVELTKNNTAMTLALAFNYTGRAEILDAVNRLLEQNFAYRSVRLILDKKAEVISAYQTNEEEFSRYLYTDGMPDVDLVIRTAGEFRLSNFLIWQTAYAEFFFTPTLWPDFTVAELDKALATYLKRSRRFGGD